VVLLEYMEQQVKLAGQEKPQCTVNGTYWRAHKLALSPLMPCQPPLLNRPGMGAKLVTYYRKKDATDLEHQNLEQGEHVVCTLTWLAVTAAATTCLHHMPSLSTCRLGALASGDCAAVRRRR
jgi:hypothetical protein